VDRNVTEPAKSASIGFGFYGSNPSDADLLHDQS